MFAPAHPQAKMGPPSDRVQQPPPPAYGAHHQGPATPEHLASQMAATELSSYRERRDTGASSSSDVLRFKIGLAYDQHTSLHDSIRPLVHIPARLTETQEQVYVLKGLLTTLRASWKRTDAHVKASHLRYKKLLPAFGGRKMLLPGRRHKLDAARSKWEREHVERGRLEEEILDKEERLRNQEDDVAEMELAIQRLQSLEQQLDMLDDDLFQGPTAGCEQEDKAEQMVAVLLRTHQSVSTGAGLPHELEMLPGVLGLMLFFTFFHPCSSWQSQNAKYDAGKNCNDVSLALSQSWPSSKRHLQSRWKQAFQRTRNTVDSSL